MFDAVKKYYQCYNALLNMELNYFCDCTCEKFEGCESCIGYENYCFVCWVWNIYSTYKFDENSYRILTLFSKAGFSFVDFQKCDDFVSFWYYDHEYLQVHEVVCIYKIAIFIVRKSS